MTNKDTQEAFSQMYLADTLAGEVQAWAEQGWPGVSRTTFELLNYWFSRDEETDERFHACQQRAIETAIYCHEILQPRTLLDLFARLAPEALQYVPVRREVERVPFPKYALKMATGSGKTWVLIALLVWQYFNRLNGERPGSYSDRFLVVTPGHDVLNRILDAFKGKRDSKAMSRVPQTADLQRSLFMPPGPRWRDRFHLQVLEPTDVQANTTPPEGSFALITNWQQFRLRQTTTSLWDQLTGAEIDEIPRGEIIADFLAEFPDLVVMNDEAHHVHAKRTARGDELIWRQFIGTVFQRIREEHGSNFGPFVQFDYSATPFYGSGQKKEFFPHIIYDYSLISAMRDMLVKQLFLEQRQCLGVDTGDLDFRAERNETEDGRKEVKSLSVGQKFLLDIGRIKLQQLTSEFREKGLQKKPVLLVLCEDTDVADLVVEHFGTLVDENGNLYDDKQVMVIHSELSEEKHQTTLEEARRRLDLIDVDDNPLRVVVSVLMLREGFDKSNIAVIVVLRASEADLLLEQIVGRGLRLMFPPYQYPELQDAKREALGQILQGQAPSNSLDCLFVVEHPRFREFYENLRKEGYNIAIGDSSATSSTGDIIAVDALSDRLDQFDIAWPVQVYDEGGTPDLSGIDPAALPRYPVSFHDLKHLLGRLVIQEMHVETGKKTRAWTMDNKYFDYAQFLRQASRAVATKGRIPIITAKQAEIAMIVDEYVSEYCFGEPIDFTDPENYVVLNYVEVYDFVVQTVHRAIAAMLQGYRYEVKGVWRRLSDVPRIILRLSRSVVTDKSIYPRLPYQVKGGGFERDFMEEVLNPSSEVLAYAKLDRKHGLKVPYRDEVGILRSYEVDFVVRSADKNYLVETKADSDIERPSVALKARAAQAWCEQASTVRPPDGYRQPQGWEYLLVSEGLFYENRGLGFTAILPLSQALRDRIIAGHVGGLFF